jgi:ABC-type bacteriocin/lantibiotic exporter with double-glycine peptidase domain
MGELRNEIGLTSHGKSLEEIKQRNNNIDLLTREFLIDTVELVSVFLIRNFETKHLRIAHGVTGTNLFAHRFQQGFGIFQ